MNFNYSKTSYEKPSDFLNVCLTIIAELPKRNGISGVCMHACFFCQGAIEKNEILPFKMFFFQKWVLCEPYMDRNTWTFLWRCLGSRAVVWFEHLTLTTTNNTAREPQESPRNIYHINGRFTKEGSICKPLMGWWMLIRVPPRERCTKLVAHQVKWRKVPTWHVSTCQEAPMKAITKG